MSHCPNVLTIKTQGRRFSSVFPTDFGNTFLVSPLSHDALAMGDAADPRRASSALSKTWQLILAPWSEAQRAALRRFGNDESSVVLFALRTDGGKLEVFVTCKAPCRAAWLSTHVIEGEWRPAASPKTKGERCNLLAQYQECCDRSNQGQRANVPASAASPARPPKDREGLQAARPPEDREDLGLPPLAAVSSEPRQRCDVLIAVTSTADITVTVTSSSHVPASAEDGGGEGCGGEGSQKGTPWRARMADVRRRRARAAGRGCA